MTHMDAEPWIRMRLIQRGVFEDGGKWRANMRGQDVGSFASKAEALKAYRQAALEKFGDMGAFPTDDEIDAMAEKVTLEATEAQGSPSAPSPPPEAHAAKKSAHEPPRGPGGHPRR